MLRDGARCEGTDKACATLGLLRDCYAHAQVGM